MKSKMLIATLLGCLVWQQGVLSQTDTTATDTNQSIGTSTINPPMAPAVTTNESSSVTTSNETAGASAATPPTAPAASTTESPRAATSNETAAASTANPPALPAVATNESPAAATPPPAPAATATESPAAATPPPAPAATVTETTTTVTPPPAPAATVTETTTTVTPPPAPAATTTESPAAATPPPAPAATAAESPAAATPPVVPAVTANESPSAAAASNETAGVSATNPPLAAAVTTNESPSVTTSNATGGVSSSNIQASASASIPLIQFQDVPITTAIENLTRQAGINYLLDPKIGYGQPDQNGQVKPEPTLSIRWENVTAAQALTALLDNYGLQITEDHRTHISRITTKDPTAPPPLVTRVIQIKYAGTSNLLESIQASLIDKRSKVLPDARTSQLVVVATENEQEALELLVSQLDKPTRQVLIETKLVEISSNPQTTKGIDWSGTLQAQHVSFGNGFMSGDTSVSIPGTPVTTTTPGTTIPGSTTTTTIPGDSTHLPVTTTVTIPSTTTPGTSTTVKPSSTMQSLLNIAQGNGGLSYNTLSGLTPAIGFLNADGASAVLSFLNQCSDAQIVSTPRVVTLDNQTATIEVTAGYPVINMAGGTQNSSGSSSVTYSNVGTILQVTPRISANNYIWLRVVPVVSSHSGDQTVTVQGGSGNPSTSYTIPLFAQRKIDSQVMIPDGDTLVMGGLVQDNPTASYTKVPLLGDIPGLGWAFRSESKSMIKDNLIIFLTPTIIKESDFQPATSAAADFLQSKPAVMKNRMNPHSPWDGAEPRGDWSNPAPIPGEFNKK